MSDSVRPHRRKPTRLLCPWDFPGKNTGVGCHFLLQCVKVKLLSHVQLLATPWTVAYQAPPPMGFPRQEYWSGVPLPSPITESEEELKSHLMKVKEESEKTGLKLNIQKTKIMASSPITSWQINGETMERVTDFIFWAPKSVQMVTAAMKLKNMCSLEEKL